MSTHDAVMVTLLITLIMIVGYQTWCVAMSGMMAYAIAPSREPMEEAPIEGGSMEAAYMRLSERVNAYVDAQKKEMRRSTSHAKSLYREIEGMTLRYNLEQGPMQKAAMQRAIDMVTAELAAEVKALLLEGVSIEEIFVRKED